MCNWTPSSCTSSPNHHSTISSPHYVCLEQLLNPPCILEWSARVHCQNKREVGPETGMENKVVDMAIMSGEVRQSGTKKCWADCLPGSPFIQLTTLYCDCLCLNNLLGFKISKSESNQTTYEHNKLSSNKSALNPASPFNPNERPYHTPPQQHSWPATVDPSTIPACSALAPPSSPAEVATNNISSQQIPQENVVQPIGGTSIGSVVPNDAVHFSHP